MCDVSGDRDTGLTDCEELVKKNTDRDIYEANGPSADGKARQSGIISVANNGTNFSVNRILLESKGDPSMKKGRTHIFDQRSLDLDLVEELAVGNRVVSELFILDVVPRKGKTRCYLHVVIETHLQISMALVGKF